MIWSVALKSLIWEQKMKKFSGFLNYSRKKYTYIPLIPQASATEENIAWTHDFLPQLPVATRNPLGCVDLS